MLKLFLMNKRYLFSILLAIPIIVAFAGDYKRSVITDPSITRRCTSLTDKRVQKIDHKQNLQSLLSRNLKLQEFTPAQKKSIKRKLKSNESHLRHELELTGLKINRLEEDIVRQGCPGIYL